MRCSRRRERLFVSNLSANVATSAFARSLIFSHNRCSNSGKSCFFCNSFTFFSISHNRKSSVCVYSHAFLWISFNVLSSWSVLSGIFATTSCISSLISWNLASLLVDRSKRSGTWRSYYYFNLSYSAKMYCLCANAFSEFSLIASTSSVMLILMYLTASSIWMRPFSCFLVSSSI